MEAKKLAGIDVTTEVQLVEFPRVLPWWQQTGEEAVGSMRLPSGNVEALEQWLATGTLATPGVVWMPPIIIE